MQREDMHFHTTCAPHPTPTPHHQAKSYLAHMVVAQPGLMSTFNYSHINILLPTQPTMVLEVEVDLHGLGDVCVRLHFIPRLRPDLFGPLLLCLLRPWCGCLPRLQHCCGLPGMWVRCVASFRLSPDLQALPVRVLESGLSRFSFALHPLSESAALSDSVNKLIDVVRCAGAVGAHMLLAAEHLLRKRRASRPMSVSPSRKPCFLLHSAFPPRCCAVTSAAGGASPQRHRDRIHGAGVPHSAHRVRRGLTLTSRWQALVVARAPKQQLLLLLLLSFSL
jgi:hypothetical protein